jgi:hypothetical protein
MVFDWIFDWLLVARNVTRGIGRKVRKLLGSQRTAGRLQCLIKGLIASTPRLDPSESPRLRRAHRMFSTLKTSWSFSFPKDDNIVMILVVRLVYAL